MKAGIFVAFSAIASILTFIGCLFIARNTRVASMRTESERYIQGVRMGWYLHVHREQLTPETIRLYGLEEIVLNERQNRRPHHANP